MQIQRKSGMADVAHLFAPFEVKFAKDAPPGSFSGYGAVFGNVDSYGDVIQKGAFKDTLAEAKKSGIWPAMLLQHGLGWSTEDMMPVGIWTDLEEDDRGLKSDGLLELEVQRAKEAYALMKMQPRPAISGLSIGYIAKEFEVGTKPHEPRRVLKRVELVEISLVTSPANPKARVDQIKAALGIKTIRDFETFLRDVGGFSHAAAKAIAAGGFKADPEPRDEDGEAKQLLESLERFTASLKS